jgi:hypothetical protein
LKISRPFDLASSAVLNWWATAPELTEDVSKAWNGIYCYVSSARVACFSGWVISNPFDVPCWTTLA